MKKIIYIIFVLVSTTVFSQSTNQNWTKTTVYKQAYTEANKPVNPTPNQATIQVAYYDGLGRPIQNISHKQSATGKDIIQYMEYDAFGRQTKTYLPIITGTTSLDYQNIDNTDIAAYYDGTHSYEATNNPYTEKELEASPLNRVLKQAAAGDTWAMGGGHEIKFDYQTNTIAEVKLFSMSTNYNVTTNIYKPTLSELAIDYPINHLYKNITIDENNTENTHNQTEEFTNKLGQVVLKRIKTNKHGVQKTFDTYYIYDIYGNLTYVLPPIVNTDQAITQVVLNGSCYQYQYDHRNRLVAKKIPGKQWEYIVYDKLDRVRATGPAKTPFTDMDGIGWLYTKYDKLNRPILTAWQEALVNENTRSVLEKAINIVTTTNNNAVPVLVLSDTRDTQLATVNNVSFNYDNLSYPTTNYHILTINYYDDYNYLNAPTDFSQVLSQNVRDGANGNTKGLNTGSWVRILENNTDTNANTSYSLYKADRLASAIKTGINYPNGGYTTTKTTVDFEGKVLHTETDHKIDSNGIAVHTEENFTYTPQGRLLKNTHEVDTNDTENLALNNYKELGELDAKYVGGTTGNNALQTVNYKYNIRGWLTDINNIETLEDDVFDLFAFRIIYTSGSEFTPSLYNGNISETYWRTDADNMIRKYTYEYDKLNRLKSAAYKNASTGVINTYNELLNYDKNGNITNLQRFGGFETPTGATMIDNLTYSYDPSSPNQLLKVVDLTNATQGFKDDVTATIVTDDTSDDYAYDMDGNMIKDENKGITSITYNHLNLPTNIQFTNNRKINYTYDATGIKLKKEVNFGSYSVATDYLNGYQYETKDVFHGGRGYPQLLFFPHTEGYVKAVYGIDVSNKKRYYRYVYNYTDHLGNIRLSYTDDKGTLKTLEENHYYPFGLKHQNYNQIRRKLALKSEFEGSLSKKVRTVPSTEGINNYKYNGKELQEELGLNWYDYGARNYQADLGRWMNIDPLASNTPSWTPYNYVENTPVTAIDPDGLSCVGCGSNGESIDPPKDSHYIAGGPGDPPKFPNTSGVQQLDEVVVNSKNSSYNPSVALENNTGYTYTNDDLNLRRQLKQSRIFNIAIKNLEKAGQFLPLGAERYMNFVGVNNYNMYRFAAGVTLAFEITTPPGAGSGSTFSRTFNYTPRFSSTTIGDDIALGLGDNLFSFAKSNGFKTYRDFSTGLDINKIKSALHTPSNRLHFNLDGFSRFQYSRFTGKVSYGNITNWELNTILKNPNILNRTTFYRGGLPTNTPNY